MTLPVIEIEVNRVRVVGQFRALLVADYSLEIIQPYCGYLTGSHIPYFARGHSRFVDNNQITPAGNTSGEQRLRELYETLIKVDQNHEAVKEFWEKHQRLTKGAFGGALDKEWLSAEKSWLRSLMKSGTISDKEYATRLKGIRKLKDHYEFRLRNGSEGAPESLKAALGGFLGDFGSELAIELRRTDFNVKKSGNVFGANEEHSAR